MDARELVKWIFQHFFIIYAGAMLGTMVFCLIFCADAQFGVDYFAWMILFSVAGDLPILVFYSPKELTNRQMLVRDVIHFILLETVLLIFAGYLKLYENFVQGCAFALVVVGVYVINRVISFIGDRKVADKVNAQLAKRRQK